MEMSSSRRLSGLKEKIPDIQKTLDMVKFLNEQPKDEKITTNYELNDTLYAKAEVTPTETVYLWLGANVMMEYKVAEAIELLQSKLDTALQSKKTCEEDLEFLRENITTMEVNTARLYNWDVQKRRTEREHEADK